jgi:hypothetical protein
METSIGFDASNYPMNMVCS